MCFNSQGHLSLYLSFIPTWAPTSFLLCFVPFLCSYLFWLWEFNGPVCSFPPTVILFCHPYQHQWPHRAFFPVRVTSNKTLFSNLWKLLWSNPGSIHSRCSPHTIVFFLFLLLLFIKRLILWNQTKLATPFHPGCLSSFSVSEISNQLSLIFHFFPPLFLIWSPPNFTLSSYSA